MVRKGQVLARAAISNFTFDSGLFPVEHVDELAGLIDELRELGTKGPHWIVDEYKGQVLAKAEK